MFIADAKQFRNVDINLGDCCAPVNYGGGDVIRTWFYNIDSDNVLMAGSYTTDNFYEHSSGYYTAVINLISGKIKSLNKYPYSADIMKQSSLGKNYLESTECHPILKTPNGDFILPFQIRGKAALVGFSSDIKPVFELIVPDDIYQGSWSAPFVINDKIVLLGAGSIETTNNESYLNYYICNFDGSNLQKKSFPFLSAGYSMWYSGTAYTDYDYSYIENTMPKYFDGTQGWVIKLPDSKFIIAASNMWNHTYGRAVVTLKE